jgi:hypothetical protein
MPSILRQVVCITALILVAACSTTVPTSMQGVYHFGSEQTSAEELQRRSDCMAEHSSFNQRQMMVSSAAVESAWVYCVRQSDIWYPGKEEKKARQDSW